jgi:hypothetical protein
VAETRFIARLPSTARRLTDHLYPPLVAEVGSAGVAVHGRKFAERTGVRIAARATTVRAASRNRIALFRVVEDCLRSFLVLARSNASVRLAINYGASNSDPSGDARHRGPRAAPLRLQFEAWPT